MVACGGMTEREGRLLVAAGGVGELCKVGGLFSQKVAFGSSNFGRVVLKLFSILTLNYFTSDEA